MKGRRFKAAQGSNRSKDREIELKNKEVWRRKKEKVFNRRNLFKHNAKVNFLQQTVKQLKVVWEVVLSEVTKLND